MDRQRSRTGSHLLAIALVLALLGCSGTGAVQAHRDVPPEGEYSRYRLTLHGADEAGGELALHLHARDARPATGWATVGTSAGQRLRHALTRRGDRLAGDVVAVVDAARYQYSIDARVRGNALAGEYAGKHGIDGAVEAIEAAITGGLEVPPETRAMALHLDLPSMYTRFGHMRHPIIEAVVRDGRVTGGRFYSASQGRRGFTGTVDGGTLRVDGDRLAGRIHATVTDGDAAHGAFTFALDGRVHNNFVQGRHTVSMGGHDWGAYGFSGTASGLGTPADDGGVLKVTLPTAIEGNSPLTLFLEREGPRIVDGLARGGNPATHSVDASGLRVTGGKVLGPVKVSIGPSAGFPPGGRTVNALYELDGKLNDGELTGSFQGRYGIQLRKSGRLDGRVLSPAELAQAFRAGPGAPAAPLADDRPNVVTDRKRTFTAAEADRIGWPALAGPYGNFQPLRTDVPMGDDLSKVAIAWVSETSDLGIGKQGTPFGKSFASGEAIKRYLGPQANRHPGNWAGVIAADGMVFASSFRPTGPQMECDFPDGNSAQVRVDAEDFVIAININSGHTVWLAAEPGGMLVGGGKRQGFQVAPVYSRGKVFAMGSTGRLFAYEAATGKKLWQSDIGPAHRSVAQKREEVLASLAKRKFAYVQSLPWHTSLTVAENTLVVPTFVKGGLRGLDVDTGEMLWEVSGVASHLATPSIWSSAGHEYILTATTNGQMRLLDPGSGRELWKVDGLGGSYFTLSPSADHVLINVNPKSGKAETGERITGFYGAFAITPQKATLAWTMPQEPKYGLPCWMDSEARFRHTMRDGLVYLNTDGTGREVPGEFIIMKEDTGRILARHTNEGAEADKIGGLWYLVGDKILCRWNNMHGPTHGGRHPWALWSIKENNITRLPGTLDMNEFTNGYEVNMEYPIVAGRLFERNEQGRLVCYDLRAK